MSEITFYGSSTFNGIHDHGGGIDGRMRAAANMRHEFDDAPLHIIHGRAAPAETIDKTLAKLLIEIENGRERKFGSIDVIQAGTYDACIDVTIKEPMTEYDTFIRHLGEFVAAASDAHREVVMVGLAPILDNEVQHGRKELYKEDVRKYYENGSREVAQREKIPFINIWRPIATSKAKLEDCVARDKIHPSTDANQVMFDVISAEIFPCADALHFRKKKEFQASQTDELIGIPEIETPDSKPVTEAA